MRKSRVVLSVDHVLRRDVLAYLLTQAGLEVAGESREALNPLRLLLLTRHLQPEAVFLWPSDPSRDPGICSHLLEEYPQLKIVVIARDHYRILDILNRRVRVRKCFDLSVDSILSSLLDTSLIRMWRNY